MSFYFTRFLRSKTKYFTIMMIIGVVYFAIHALFILLPEMYAEVNPKYIFDVENVYELKSLTSNHSILGIKANIENEIKFNDELVQDLKNTKGIHSACLSEIFSPLSKIYGSMPLNDSIQNFNLYGLGEGFEDVLKLEIFKNDNANSLNPEIYIESSLAEKFEKTGLNGKELEVGKEKSKYNVKGTFSALGVTDREKGNLFTGIQKIKESGRILIRLSSGTDIENIENSIYSLLVHRYNADRSAFDLSPLSLSGKESWFEYRNQIISIFLIVLISLLYVMLSLLGLYWNETKSRNVEIGIMRSIGFTKIQVFGIIIKEATIISVVAILFAQIIIFNVYPEELKSPVSYLISLALYSAILLGIVWLSVLIPAVKSSQIQPARALSEE